MAIVFKSLTLRNFLSFGNVPTTVILDRPGTTLILGEDLDNTTAGTGANGVGKTTILNALVFAVYGKTISDISKDNLVNNINKKNMEVIVVLIVDGVEYKIHRARKMKSGAAGNWVQLFEDGKDITPDNISHTNTKIEDFLGIPYDLFVRIVTFSANHTAFLDLPVRSHYAANQTGFIEELFNLTTLSEKATLLKDKIKETELSLQTQTAYVDQLKKEHERHENQIESATRRIDNWVISNANEIKEIEDKLAKISDIDFDTQRALHDELKEVDAKLRGEITVMSSIEKNVASINRKHTAVKKELKHLLDAECPYCKQKYEDTESKIKENEALVIQYENEIHAEGELLIVADDNVEAAAALHKQIKDSITVDNMDELLEIRSKADRLGVRLKELKKATNPFIEPLEELENIKLDPIDLSSINELNRKIDHQKFLLKLLTKKDSFVRKALLNKNIPYLNKQLSGYLIKLGLPHTVEFTHEMTASISQFGRHMDFGNLSNGQRARVNLALSFSFRDVLQQLHHKVNVCMLDEVLDVGLDTVGVQAAAELLKMKAQEEGTSMYIISHKDEITNAFEQKLTVQMSKGFSYLKFEED